LWAGVATNCRPEPLWQLRVSGTYVPDKSVQLWRFVGRGIDRVTLGSPQEFGVEGCIDL
jgi:hypothetical protein